MCRRTEEEVGLTVGLPKPWAFRRVIERVRPSTDTVIPRNRPFSRLLRLAGDTEDTFST